MAVVRLQLAIGLLAFLAALFLCGEGVEDGLLFTHFITHTAVPTLKTELPAPVQSDFDGKWHVEPMNTFDLQRNALDFDDVVNEAWDPQLLVSCVNIDRDEGVSVRPARAQLEEVDPVLLTLVAASRVCDHTLNQQKVQDC